MSKWDKLIERITSLESDIRFEELAKVLESCGYVMSQPHGGSSHYTFRKPGRAALTIPKHKPIKRIYVMRVKEIVEREIQENEND